MADYPFANAGTSGQFLAAPAQYAPASQVGITTESATLASLNAAPTTVAAGSNGGTITGIAAWAFPSAGVLDVTSTAGWTSAGTISVATSNTPAVVTYTGITATGLTGCAYVSGGTGTVATGGAVTLTAAGTGAAAVPAVSTGNFTAPASGSVVVSAAFVSEVSASGDGVGFALCAHGTLTPVLGAAVVWKYPVTTQPFPLDLTFLVSGLTPGTVYNFDLMFCVGSGGTLTVLANTQTATTPNVGNTGIGAPVVMTVQQV